MKNFLKHNGLWVLFAGAVIAVGLAAASLLSANSSPLVNLANTISSPFRSACTAVATWFNDKQNYYRDTTALEEENRALRQQLAEMEDAIRQAEIDSAENARLRELLNLRAQRRDLTGDMEAAFVTEHTVSNWASTLTLNKGTDHGVENGDCVVDETGALVGLVSECGGNWSRVLTVVDTDSSFGAQAVRTKELGIARGEFALMSQYRLRLDYLPAESQLMAGDLVVTSGLGGFYPSGLVIGTVEDVQLDDSGASAYAIVAPGVSLDTLEEVFIIKSFEIIT